MVCMLALIKMIALSLNMVYTIEIRGGVYQIGTNANNDFNARIAYELIQW